MPTLWADQLLNEAVGAGGGRDASFLGLSTLSALDRRIQRFTLIRTIIGINIEPTVPDSGEGDQLVSLGIGIMDNQQSVVADMPDPAVEAEFPTKGWTWRAQYRVYAVAAGDQNRIHQRVDLDIRAQRKLENGRPALVLTNTDNQGVATAVSVTGIIRMLYLVS